MLISIYTFIGVSLIYIQCVDSSSVTTSPFQFTDQARADLCPFVGTEGMRCFDGHPTKPLGRNLESDYSKLPRAVGMSVHGSSGQIKALAVQLTYPPEGSRTWTDGHTGVMFDIFNEAIIGSANRVAAAYDAASIRIFHEVSQLNTAWRQTLANGTVRGGELARSPDLLEYFNK